MTTTDKLMSRIGAYTDQKQALAKAIKAESGVLDEALKTGVLLDDIQAEIEALVRDAERYKYLVAHLADRPGDSRLHAEWERIDAVLDKGEVPSKELFDAAIDASMKGETP